MPDIHLGQAQPDCYTALLDQKTAQTAEQFAAYYTDKIQVFPSSKSHFRMRAEFRIWHEGKRSFYAMYESGNYKQPKEIKTFSIGSQRIAALMPALLEAIHTWPELREKLYQVEFLTTLTNDALITLIYHRPLDEQWQNIATQLQEQLGAGIIGRSRKQKRVLERDFVLEQFSTDAGVFTYRQYETGFTQPNAKVCEQMLNWAYQHAQHCNGDLLELYCGNGNFTLPLSKAFNKILATEVSKLSTKAALENIALNHCNNIELARLSAEEVTQAIDGTRRFNRLSTIDLDSYHFSTLFVDPPRAGLDEATTRLASRFETIIYISCNPDTLLDNLIHLTQSHNVVDLALFDQFPYTQHRECGVILKKK